VVWLIILADLVVGREGSGLLPELLRALGHTAAAEEGGAWYLKRWPWILAVTLLAAPASAGEGSWGLVATSQVFLQPCRELL
jgi:hypothetical protein